MLNKTSNWPGVSHLRMVELEIIPSLGLFPRLAGLGRFAWRADTLSRARIPHRSLFGFYFYFFVQTVSEVISRHLLIHKNGVALSSAEAAACEGNGCQGSSVHLGCLWRHAALGGQELCQQHVASQLSEHDGLGSSASQRQCHAAQE